ncbi:hypothetical protein GJAV_G00129230 [Gymnothorax javanicus]|nr:hypothetical protein GJAV_G00129230 [Gymnothorax javanicus]
MWSLLTCSNGECSYSACRMNFFNNVFIVSLENATSTCAVLPSSPDSLVLSFISLDAGDIIRSLYVFGRTKTLSESDLQMYHKQLECLSLPPPSFKYDGKQDMCPDQEKPAPEEHGQNH